MRISRLISRMTTVVGVALLMAASPAVPQERDAVADMLDAHNEAREDVGLPPLRWSGKLAQDASGWAEHLARRNLYDHAPPSVRKGQGENLWRGSRDRWSDWEKIGFFLAEKRYFRPGNFPDVSRTGQWSDVGHYTQIIWPETREVGCAIARTARDEVLVCRYWPAGNIWGHPIDPRQHVAAR
jgi:hypothetical protein